MKRQRPADAGEMFGDRQCRQNAETAATEQKAVADAWNKVGVKPA